LLNNHWRLLAQRWLLNNHGRWRRRLLNYRSRRRMLCACLTGRIQVRVSVGCFIGVSAAHKIEYSTHNHYYENRNYRNRAGGDAGFSWSALGSLSHDFSAFAWTIDHDAPLFCSFIWIHKLPLLY
jgi:hypothetical protein